MTIFPAQRTNARARDALLRTTPTRRSSSPENHEWLNPAIARPRVIARPWEGGHSLAWLLWMLGGVLTVLQLNNPLYLALVWGCAVLVYTACATDGPLAHAFGLLVRLGGVIFGLHVLFSIITAGSLRGATVLVRLPVWTLPAWLGGLQLGGTVSLEQIISGAVRGGRLWTLLLVMGAFNASVNHYRLLRRTPRAFFHAGLLVTISLAFVPQTVLRLRAIREAQRLRGHRFRGWRDALPLFVPLLSGGLERSLMLAEAMEARGYGRGLAQPTRQLRWTQSGLVVALALVLLGVVGYLFYPGDSWAWRVSVAALLGGVVLLGSMWRRISRRVQHTQYRRERWRWPDTATATTALIAPLGVWLFGAASQTLQYRVFPQVGLPPFDLLVALPILLLAVPALVLGTQAKGQGLEAQNRRQRLK